MEFSPVTDSAELHIPRDLLCSTQPDAVISTTAKDVPNTHGLKWWLDCYPAGRNSAAGQSTTALFSICLRLSQMPVKCRVKYTIADISETTDVMGSTLTAPVIFSINRDVLIRKTGNDGLTFKCEITFTHVPKAICIPAQLHPSQFRSFTSTITTDLRLQKNKAFQETPIYTLDTDGKLVWSVMGCMYKTKKGKQIRLVMRTSAANCYAMVAYKHTASNTYVTRRDVITAANPNAHYCKATFYPTEKVVGDALAIKCTVSFTFPNPLLPPQCSANVFRFPKTTPWPIRNAKPFNRRVFTVSVDLPIKALRSNDDYQIKSNVQNGPGDLKWWIKCEPDLVSAMPGESSLVSWHVSKKPIEATVRYTELHSNNKQKMKVVVSTHDSVPKLLFKTNNDAALTRADDECMRIRCCFIFSKNSPDNLDDTPSEDGLVSGNESDDTSEYTSSEDGDGCSEEDGMTDQERLAYRLRRQNEETIAVQKLLAKIKNVPMIADGSTF